MLYPRNTLTRRVMCLDGFWKFKFDPQGEGQKGGWTSGLSDAVVFLGVEDFGRYRQRQNAESPGRERQRSRWKRNGPVGRPSSVGGSGRTWLSAAPIRMIWSMVFSGGW